MTSKNKIRVGKPIKRKKKKSWRIKGKYRILSVIVLATFVTTIALAVYGFQAGTTIPASDIEEETVGYAVFNFIDGETGQSLSGDVILTKLSDQSKPAGSPVSTGISVPIVKDDPCIATIYDINLPNGDDRVFLPASYYVVAAGDEDEPTINSYAIYYYANRSSISINITKVDGMTGHFNETSFEPGEEYTIELNITVDMRSEYSIYGYNSFVPLHIVPEINLDNGIYGFGLWLLFNSTDIYTAEVKNKGIYTVFTYVDEWDSSIIMPDPIYGEVSNQEITFELKGNPSAIHVFEGYLTDFSTTNIQIK